MKTEREAISTVDLEYAVQKWSLEDLRFANHIVVAEINHKRGQVQTEKISRFRVGQRVKFLSKYGKSVEGTIEKINRKTIGLGTCTDGIKWRIGTLDKLEIVEKGAN